MDFTACLFTNKGGYPKNEDNADYSTLNGSGLFVVADGLGGHKNGDLASELVVKTLIEGYKNTNETEDKLNLFENDWLYRANDKLIEQQQNSNYGKSTIAALLIDKTETMFAHVGDTRIYHIKNGEVFHATQDHSVTYKKYLSGEITARQINSDDDRTSLLRVMGDANRFKPQFFRIDNTFISSKDAFLLCTDGFWENIFNEEILADYLKASCPEEWVENMLLRIVPRMTPKSDNLTAIALFVQ